MYGLGGIGKTQLAIEYAYRHAAEYRVAWWLRADEPTTLAADYAGLAAQLNLAEQDASDQSIVVAAVRAWLEQHTGWLLVFDNANEPAEVEPYLPRQARGHILITSRNPNWGAIARPARVPTLPPDEAVEFLLRRTGQSDAAAAGELAEALDYLPLALAQAGAYIEATGQALADYLGLFQNYRSELLAQGQPTDYPATVAKTWELAYKRVRQRSRAAADLLSLCAYLGADNIPLAMLLAGAEHLSSPLAAAVANPLKLDSAIAALRRYSLLERSLSTLSLHRMVQAVVRDWLTPAARQTWAAAAVLVVDTSFQYEDNDPQTWIECANLLPHALNTAEHAAVLNTALETTANLLNSVGPYLRRRAEFAAAKGALEQALAIGKATYGSNHSTVATYINNLGGVLRSLGDFVGAKAAYERALAIDEATYGPNHPTAAIRVNNLGSVLRALGDLAGAKVALERALAIDEATYGPNYPDVAIDINNLGGVLRALGDLGGAKAAYERALAIDEATYGPNHHVVATDVNNIAMALWDLGDLAGTKAALERALAIRRDSWGEEHPATIRSKNNLEALIRQLEHNASG